jgi:flagellar basal-body rod protein FlgF
MSSTDNTFQEIDRLKLVNSEGQELKIRKDGLYETESKQPLPEDGAIGVMVGALEGSSAKPVELMVQMIKDSRDYEMQVRVIKNAKEISTSSASMIRMDS